VKKEKGHTGGEGGENGKNPKKGRTRGKIESTRAHKLGHVVKKRRKKRNAMSKTWR